VATLPGGDIQGFGNVEYRIPIVGPVTAVLFFDGGTDGVIQKSNLKLTDSGFENLTDPLLGFGKNVPNLSQQLALAPGTNFRLRASTGIEFGVQLPIIQAPFRIYYAYNVHRLHQELVAPNSFITESQLRSLCSELGGGSGCTQTPIDAAQGSIYREQIEPLINLVLQNPGRLNYFEPKTTFRFTVSRTF
jgi:outer membrane protein insertion porin family